MRKKLIPFIAVLLLMSSCSMSKKITYFQDVIVSSDSTVVEKLPPEITLRPEDKISIIVNSKDPELSNLFNLPYVTRSVGSGSDNASSHGVSN
jgi:polysaccharide export outer membrane protein